jgi:glucosamine--fructose-6-phosphate aminotransferase (isomerizing)
MCGIIGFLGKHQCECFDYLYYGLKQLQNRGYDSAGISAIDSNNNNQLKIHKYASQPNDSAVQKIGKISNKYKNGFSNGIMHSRWATHGAKTDINAHPHMDNTKRIALVHNGIIENYYELKKELKNKYSIHFESHTDTEVIVNLISVYYNQTKDEDGVCHMEEAIMMATNRLQGTWALVIQCIDKPDNLYCARYGSPLLIGFAEDYFMVASEQAGFGKYVNNYICLESGDITVLRRRDGTLTLRNLNKYELRDVTVSNNELTPDPYPHWTLKEIYEQYDASIRAISFGGRLLDDNHVQLGGPMQRKEELKEIEHLIILGCGTSLNAGKHAIGFFKELCDFTTVQAFVGSEFTELDIPRRGKSAFVLLSQSGETKDLYRCIKIGKDNDIMMIGIVNVVDSMIAREVDCGCYLNAGREVGVASTKAFTSQVIVLSMLAIFFAQIKDLHLSKRKRYIQCLRQLPQDIKKTIQKCDAKSKEIAEYLKDQEHCFILGKGGLLSIAEEGALKTKEIGYIHSEAYGGNALRHGPYALLEEGTPVIFLSPDDEHFALMNNTVEEVASRQAYPITISDAVNGKVSHHSKITVNVPKNEVFKGVLHNVVMQLVAYHLAVQKGISCDFPRGLAKVCSV